jgi:hypothetical protein
VEHIPERQDGSTNGRNVAYFKVVQTLITIIGILGLVFVAFAALFVASLLIQLAMRPFAPKLAKKYDHLKGMLPAGPPRAGHASVIHLDHR